jgi:mRNA deadenylase 3'-5' endonuclease subunit Ccr4
MTVVNIVSYNVLSDALSDAKHYAFSDPADCEPTTRLARVMGQLKRRTVNRSIICLQEVSRAWFSALLPFWERQGYGYVNALSGPPQNNYMGQVIAWPRDLYELQECDVVRVADTVTWPKQKGTKKPNKRTELDVWKEVRKRHNCVALVLLCPRGGSSAFAVGNYHMPCLFGSDRKCQVMTAHAALMLSHAQRFCRGIYPLVVTGDFNFKPYDSTYELVRDGKLPNGHPHTPPVYLSAHSNGSDGDRSDDGDGKSVVGWKPTMEITPMRSTYAVMGRESTSAAGIDAGSESFTNFARTKGQPEAFCDTLDYIFVSEEWKVTAVSPLPTRASLAAGPTQSFPSPAQPSDHLLIGAVLELELQPEPAHARL